MKVRATQEGFYQKYREPGDEFEVEKHMFSDVWMEKIETRGRKKKVEQEPDGDNDLQ